MHCNIMRYKAKIVSAIQGWRVSKIPDISDINKDRVSYAAPLLLASTKIATAGYFYCLVAAWHVAAERDKRCHQVKI